MKKFNTIKKSRKKSKDIDEKIEYLDKECQKTGLNETNTTSGVYVGSTSNPNSGYAEITGKNFNGKGFAMSGDSNLGQGSFGGASIRADGAALSPPHPVTGERRTTQTKGSFGFKLAIPGERPTPEHRMTGPIMWYWNPSGGGGSGSWESLEYNSAAVHGNQPYPFGGDNAGWGYWGSDFMGFPLLRSDGAAFASLFNTIDNFDPKDSIPFTTVLTKDRLDDPSFLPIDIAGLSVQGFNFLKRRAGGSGDSSDPDDPEEFEKKYGEEEKDNEEEERKKREELVKKLKLGFASAVGLSLKTIQRLWSNGTALGNLWKMTDSFLKGDTDFDSLNRLSNSITKTVGRAIGEQAGVPTPTNFLFRYDKWLASGAKGKVDMTRYIDPRSAKILSNAANKLDGPFMKSETIKQQFKRLTSEGKSREEALDKIATAVQTSVDNQTNADSKNANLKMAIGNGIQIDRTSFIKSGGKVIKFSKGYKFAENVGSVKGVGDTMLGRFYGAFGVEMDTFGSGKYAVPAIIGAKYGLQTVHRKYGGSPDRAPQMPYSFTVKSGITGDISESYWKTYEWIDLTKVENDEPISLQEDVKLGHFEPEVLNVDINDLRKGIMPEFPKDPPPEMINGYSAKSRLLPKKVEGTPFINVTRKDLARNHKLTDKEITEYMNDIKMINDYIKKNPAELIYAMTRYPKHDPRLAQLNWKMDQMKAASDEYMETHFPENQKLFKKLQDKIIRNINQTDPKNFTGHKEAPKFSDDNVEISEQRKKIVSKYFKKPVKIKKLFNR